MKFTTAWLTTNRTCNNRCKWCYAQNSLDSKTIMNLEDAKKLVDILEGKGVKRIILIGGEPTIYPGFIELVKYIRAKSIHVSIATNGRKFQNMDFSKEVIKAGINGIDFSLKAVTEEEYLANTGSYGLEQMIQGYNNLVNLGFIPSLSYVIVDDNYEKFDRLLEFITRHGFSKVAFQFVKPVLEQNENTEILDLKRMGAFVKYMYSRLSQTTINYVIEISFPLCLIDREVLEELIKQGKIINCCHVPRGTGINFDENFKIIPCNHFGEFPFSEKPISLENKNSIEEILDSKVVEEFRTKARCYPAEKCRECNLWSICGGGCFTRWLTINPNDYIK